MGCNGYLAQQQFWKAHVRVGSEADILHRVTDVRFTPNSGHQDCLGSRLANAHHDDELQWLTHRKSSDRLTMFAAIRRASCL